MQTTPSLLNPSNYITYQALKRQEHEICVAIEIYLAEKCARIHYADLMDNLPSHLASKDSLLAWLNDKVVKGQLVRKGIISLYKQERSEDFEYGVWKPINFPLFVKYAAEKLTNKGFVNSRKLAETYNRSFQDAVWLSKASAVMGLKLLEELHKHGQLRSVTAKAILDMNERSRELLEKTLVLSAERQETMIFRFNICAIYNGTLKSSTNSNGKRNCNGTASMKSIDFTNVQAGH